jgi:hypothetical protein
MDIEHKRYAPNRLGGQIAPRTPATAHLVPPAVHVLQLSG